jgi:hypothetical protein
MEVTDALDQPDAPLDIVCLLLALVVKPVSCSFDSGPFSVADHNGHIFSVSVNAGVAKLASGSPIARPSVGYDEEVSTSDAACDRSLAAIAGQLKQRAEEVNDIAITGLALRFGLLRNRPPVLLGCAGSTFVPSSRLEPFVSAIQMITLFYALEASVVPITAECITRGRFCLAGSQTIERSRIVSLHIKKIVETLKFPDASAVYLKRRIMALLPAVMMQSVPVCGVCFKFYNLGASQKQSVTPSNGTRDSASLVSRQIISRATIVRPKTTMVVRQSIPPSLSRVPIVRAKPPVYRVGDVTPSGLRVTSDRSTVDLELARLVYRDPPFKRPSPVFLSPVKSQ